MLSVVSCKSLLGDVTGEMQCLKKSLYVSGKLFDDFLRHHSLFLHSWTDRA